MATAANLPLQSSTAFNSAAGGGAAAASAAAGKKTIEEIYQKKSQLEHILLRPDTYVGSVEKHTQNLWVYENGEMVHRAVTYVPGLYKIFDEILVNAADNKQRDSSMDAVKVEIDVGDNRISIYNSGDGVPVEIHQEERVYVPELIFGHLLTSSNYDDNVKKTTGGRNGYGAKLTNIFSTEFIIETADGKRQKKYKQVFSDNMGRKSEPSITKCKAGENWTKVTFRPDLAKFKMTYLEEDVVALMKKRVVDIAGTLGKSVKVELNGQRVPVKSFADYVNMYLQSASKSRPEPLPRISEKVNERWEICVSLSEGQFQQVSFVNGIATIKGGTHVEYVTNQITNHIMTVVNKKNKNANLKAHNVRSHLWVFVNALIDNPAFDSQTKETLTTRQGSFGSKCELSQDFLKKVAKSGVVNTLLSWADFKQSKELKKTDGAKRQRITGIPKLEDANDAGGKNSDKCTLILTEGDSAKALAMAGVSVVGRNSYGVFPLRGKLLNVREANHKQIMDNAEIQNIKQILGLQHGKEYESTKGLRYGHLMIMTDQDHDGSHIKGLLINFIHTFWPSLLKVPSFMVEFITPLLKATHNKNKTVLSFYSMPEYEAWKGSLGGNPNGWSIKYYKGLGTSKSEEGKDYFKNIHKHKKEFVWMNEQDGDAIELAFSKKKIDARKKWLSQFNPENYLDQSEQLIKYSDFINKELILFSRADLQRSIPSMVDGLKPGQRKILFCAFKRNFIKQAKVAQFVGYVSEKSAYHHGEQSLATTIIGMAQDFVGSNNVNLLQPEGQFGTRHQGGKDHASARYIFTCLSPVTRSLFPKDDDILLDYLNEDGQSIEPAWYMPIIPMVLVNGSEGIGTGWSSYVPNYNPKDIVANIRRLLNDEPVQPMDPWYRGFKGRIEKSATKEAGITYTITGAVEEVDDTTLRITELPVRRWTQDYKEYLESIMTGNDKIKEPFIKDYREYNDDKTVHFEVTLTEESMKFAKQEGLEKKFKLTTTVSTTNMHLFNPNGVIKKYDNPEQILEDFYRLRYEFYDKRKRALLENLEMDLRKLDNKVRFILGVVRGEIVVNNRKKADLLVELQQKGFTPIPQKTKGIDAAVAGATEEEEQTQEEETPEVAKGGVKASDYEYLLSMAIGSLTAEKVEELCAEKDRLEGEVEELRRTPPKSLWLKELDALEDELDKMERKNAEDEDARKDMRMKANAGQGPKKPRKNAANNSSVGASANTAADAGQKKPKGGGSKRAPAKKQVVEESDEDEDILALKDRLAVYSINSSPESAAMETDQVADRGEQKKQATRNAAERNNTITTYANLSGADETEQQHMTTIPEDEKDDRDLGMVEAPKGAGRGRGRKPANERAKPAATATIPEDEKDDDDDDDLGMVEAPKGAGRGRGRKPANERAKPAATAATRKRGPAAKKVVAEVSNKPSESARDSPKKKVRKTRASPFNKKSGSGGGSSSSGSPADTSEVSVARTRPKREYKKKAVYLLSDSEEGDESPAATDDSDFEEKDA